MTRHLIAKQTILIVAVLSVAVPAGAGAAAPTSVATGVAGRDAGSALVERPGDCLKVAARSWRRVSCSKPHNFEVAARLRVPKRYDTGKPLDSAPAAWGITRCTVRSVPRYLGTDRPFSDFVPAVLRPTTRAWRSGDRTVVCGGAVRRPDVDGWVDTVGRFDPATGTPLCASSGGLSACLPGAVAFDRAVQLYPAAWKSPYPGAAALNKRARELGRGLYPAGTDFVVWGGFSKAEWSAGYGRFARLGIPLQ